jgi:uncharacterized protein YybS (DUF2232 family)
MITRALMVVLGAGAGYLLFGAAGGLGAGAVLVNLFTPLPAAALGMRLGPAWGTATVGLTAAAVVTSTGSAAMLLYLVQFGLPAVLLPWLLSREVHWDRAIFVTLGLMLTLGVVILIGVTSGSGTSPTEFVDAQIDKEIEQAVTLMERLAGAEPSPEESEAFREMTARMSDLMHRGYPGMLVVVCGVLQLVTVGLLALLSRPKLLPGPSLARWRAPEQLVWVLIAALFAVLFASGALQTVAINVLIIILPVYFLQGLAVVEHFYARTRMSTPLRAFSYLLLLLVNPLPVIVTGVGVFDLLADFRKPRLKKD